MFKRWPRWARRDNDLGGTQDRAFAEEEPGRVPQVDVHEERDRQAYRKRRPHPLRQFFGSTMIIARPSALQGFRGQHYGTCVVQGRMVVFDYFLPAHRAVMDQLAGPESAGDAAAREQWCAERGLQYFYAIAPARLDLQEIARRLGILPPPEEE